MDKHLTYFDVVGLVLLSLVLTYGLYRQMDPRGLGIVGVLLLVCEVFSQMKWRTAMICRNCGFDPVVYVRSPEQAGLKIKAFLERRSESPMYLLRTPVQFHAQKSQKAENLSLKF